MGFRIFQRIKSPDQAMLAQFRSVAAAAISDCLHRINGSSHSLRPYHKGGKLAGAALTVKTRPGDNLMVHKALEMAVPGDVIVVDAGGDVTNAIAGEIMLRIAQKKQIAGFVIDGAIRDSHAFAAEAFPVYARGITHRGPYKDGPGEINVPVSIGGMVVKPGDIVIGDEDGLVVVDLEEAESVLRLVQELQIRESDMLRSIEEGTIDRSWIDRTLLKQGCDPGSSSQ
jgi:regulator of RNase E activity RraA